MNYSNQYHDSISTVQLSPFSEDQWNRIVTYSPIYVHWTDLVMLKEKPANKSKSRKRNLINLIDINSINTDDELLLNELQKMRRAAGIPTLTKLKEKSLYHEAKFLDEEYDRRTTSPSDDYQSSTDFLFQKKESLKPHSNHIETSSSNQQYNMKRSQLQPQTSTTGLLKVLPNVDFGPKPQASLGVQLRQSTIAHEYARATALDHRSISPLTMSSPRRAIGSAHSGRRTYEQQCQSSNSQISQINEKKVVVGLYEKLPTNTPSPIKKSSYPRSTNTSRSTIHMLKTKNDRARQKQHIELKTILVDPCKQPIFGESELEESIPNSIEIMRSLGGPITAFENTLRYNYHRQLNQFRNGSTKC